MHKVITRAQALEQRRLHYVQGEVLLALSGIDGWRHLGLECSAGRAAFCTHATYFNSDLLFERVEVTPGVARGSELEILIEALLLEEGFTKSKIEASKLRYIWPAIENNVSAHARFAAVSDLRERIMRLSRTHDAPPKRLAAK